MNRYIVVLAAGQGTRMKSKLYKVLHPVAGVPMVECVIRQVEKLQPEEIVTVVGCGAEKVKALLGDRSQYVLQKEQLGTGHAVLQAKNLLQDKEGTTLVICGDTPLLQAATLEKLFEEHERRGAAATILSAEMDNPFGYGRIIRDSFGNVQKIVEQKDATEEEQAVTEINTGTYCFDNKKLFESLEKVGNDNAQGEYYLPDVISILKQEGNTVAAYQMDDANDSLGVNDRIALAKANQLMFRRINETHMRNGVTMIDPDHTYIEPNVKIGSDTYIEPDVMIKGDTVIGSDCFIGAGSEIIDSVLEDGVQVNKVHMEKATMRKGSNAGPFARLRPNAELGEDVHVGDFVEVKNATLGRGTKAGHLAYIGDATLGEDINVGCGAIFVNYDGVNKHHSTVGNHAFIGSNSNIVAPVTIEDEAFIAAGSTITEDVPQDALAIARSRQTNKEDYVKKLPQFKNESK